MKKVYKIMFICCVLFCMLFNFGIVRADTANDVTNNIGEAGRLGLEIGNTAQQNSSSIVDNIFRDSKNWFSEAESGGVGDNTDIGGIFEDLLGTSGSGGLVDVIFQIGNVAFICITMVLGVKYVFSSIEGKADVKEGLITLSIGAIFFYLAQSVYKFFEAIFNDFTGAENVAGITEPVFSIVSTLSNFCAIAAIVMIGIKYMFTAADERAELKEKMVPLVIGLALIYSTVKVLSFIVTASSGVFRL